VEIMSLVIPKYEDIDILDRVNGVSIKEIERRARLLIRDEISNEFKYDAVEYPRTPDEEDYTNLLRAIRSQIGFLGITLFLQTHTLGADESFQQVLKQDWKTVSDLHLTHALLAQHLRQVSKPLRQT
jgi:uncharacterized protein YydD (DUF2326 family)